MIDIQLAADDRESLRIDSSFVAIPNGNTHCTVSVILGCIFFRIGCEEIEILFAGKLPTRTMPNSLIFKSTLGRPVQQKNKQQYRSRQWPILASRSFVELCQRKLETRG